MSTRREQRPIPDEGPYKAFVGNLPLDLVPGELDKLFETFEVVSTKMIRDRENDNFKGFAYVEFKNREDLEKALDLDSEQYDGRPLRVDVADAPRGREQHGGGRGGFGGGREFGGGRGGGSGGFRGEGRRGGGGGGFYDDRRGFNDANETDGWPEGQRSDYGRYGGGGRKGSQQDDVVISTNDPERPRLQLKPRTTDPEELEKIKKTEEEEMKKRQARIFGTK